MPEAELVAGQEQRRRGVFTDVLYVLAPLVLLAAVWLAVTWYSRADRQSANRDLVQSILRSFAAGIDYGEPLPPGVDHTVRRTDLVLTVHEELRLERLSQHFLTDAQGHIVDVWGTPLRARRGSDWLEVRSAGEDQRMGSDDDEIAARPIPPLTLSNGTPPAETQTPRSDDRGVPAAAP